MLQWREKWVADGCQWFSSSKARPKVWNPVKELHSLLKRKRPVHPPVISATKREQLDGEVATQKSPKRTVKKAARKVPVKRRDS